ncbi:PLP-dependent transferase [Labilibaculum sp. DW002]|uniref:PLP-dependent transferase n=1 Tax=Paralabilibaculum antarcticum TaxID=2912572 RepID=A0ABT5VPR2_9BACT|nr:PLP-dependent transferase [Labilibaculum sp. DW002]MDE5417272.1 PLP-dependent transferase [Labilibaculum sp. DW002]
MTINPYRNIACGKSIPPNNVHAISVSLPTIQDVCSYEENKNNWRSCMETGYPRFFCHPYEIKVVAFFRSHFSISDEKYVFLFPSKHACQLVKRTFAIEFEEFELGGIFALSTDSNCSNFKNLCEFIQHTGYKVFSRQLENFLFQHQIIPQIQAEELLIEAPENHIKIELQKQFDLPDHRNIELFSSGMNAIYSLFSAIKKSQESNKASVFVQYGWLYTDTIDILRKYSKGYYEIISVYKESELEKVVKEYKGKIAAVFTETPTNPSLHTPDLPLIHSILKAQNIPLVVDGTIGSCVNLNYLPYCDFAVESLTKFASGMADVMAGTVVSNPNSKWVQNNEINLTSYQDKLYTKDLQRLAIQIGNFEQRVRAIRNNAFQLAQFFESHPAINKVNWSHNEYNKQNYSKLEKEKSSYSGLISIEFDHPIQKFYDTLDLPKGPSLGTEFTLVMPYFYLAHYEEINCSDGRRLLKEKNINWELVRISVGTEPIEELITVFEKALKAI